MEPKRFSEYERTGKLQRTIDVYISSDGKTFTYLHSTNWWKRQKDAIEAAKRIWGEGFKYKACWGDK